jgi:hypothetical protein
MGTPVRLYQQEMHDNTGFFATWFPGDPIEIGDIGILEGGRFRRMASLKELGIKFGVERGESRQNVDYTSTQGTKISTSGSATAATIGKAEISVDFSRQGAFLFQASKLQVWQIEHRMAVGEEVVKAYQRKKWDKSWLLVESLHAAERSTIIVSEDNAAGLVLVAELNEAVPSVSLVDPKVSLSVTSLRGKLMRLIGSEGLHPLYSCLRLKDPLFGTPSLHPVRGVKETAPDTEFSRPGIADLLNS